MFDKRERNNVKGCAHFLFYEFVYLFLRFFYYIIYFPNFMLIDLF